MSTRRSTRKRKVIPIEELKQRESEADAEFWGQAAFADDGEDEEFDIAGKSDEDVVDSDFDAPEAGADDEDGEEAEKQARADERAASKRSGGYVDPAKRGKKRRASASGPATREKRAAATVIPRTGLRNSTKRASMKAAESRARREEEEAVRRAKRAAREAARVPVREPTQEEKLAEAAETERANAESLRDLLRLEEERKRVPVRKKKRRGPLLSVRDRAGVTTISFTDPKTNVAQVLFPQLDHESQPCTPSETEQEQEQMEESEEVEKSDGEHDEDEGNPAPGGTSSATEGLEQRERNIAAQDGHTEKGAADVQPMDVVSTAADAPSATANEPSNNPVSADTKDSHQMQDAGVTESKTVDVPTAASTAEAPPERSKPAEDVPSAGATTAPVSD